MKYADELEFAEKLAREAGVIMRRYFRAEDIGTVWKEDDTPVTVADTMINSMVIKHVKKAYPNHGVIGEEESYEVDRDFVWVVDPIDGTVPFSLGMPLSTFLLALVDRSDGQPVVSVVYDPYLDHMYTAAKGHGAYINGMRIHSTDAKTFFKGYVSIYGHPVKTEVVDYSPGLTLNEIRKQDAKALNFVSGAYTAAKVASGEFLFVVMGEGKSWDTAAICLLVEESGGIATDIEGNKRRYDEHSKGSILAANRDILDKLMDIIRIKK